MSDRWQGVLTSGKFYRVALTWECRDALERASATHDFVLPEQLLYEDTVSGIMIFKEPRLDTDGASELKWYLPSAHVAFIAEAK